MTSGGADFPGRSPLCFSFHAFHSCERFMKGTRKLGFLKWVCRGDRPKRWLSLWFRFLSTHPGRMSPTVLADTQRPRTALRPPDDHVALSRRLDGKTQAPPPSWQISMEPQEPPPPPPLLPPPPPPPPCLAQFAWEEPVGFQGCPYLGSDLRGKSCRLTELRPARAVQATLLWSKLLSKRT